MKRALITGITGQDGSYLTDFLLTKDYEVHGIVRRSSSVIRSRIDDLTGDAAIYQKRLHLHYADLDDATTIRRLLAKIRPHEVYHLAGQSHVAVSFEVPESTCQFTAMGTLKLLEILRDCDPAPRFLHTGSSEIFGMPAVGPQNEETPFRPVTPYGVAKAFAVDMVRVYRDSFGLFACNAICFNHESPRRGETFVTRKITRGAARIKLGLDQRLSMGSVDARRDWGYAPDFVDAFWRMMQLEQPMDLVLATGKLHQVRDWLDIAFGHVGLDWQEYVDFDPRFLRKADPQTLVGDSRRAQQTIGWQPQISFEQMVKQMVDAELKRLQHT
ncbi:MAG: GDP-mannose 4,6-dehydratase [Planctomycetales bacterium]|nr:GDP-mannose 4,6-dehydratase [Planctomycetales bacterium]